MRQLRKPSWAPNNTAYARLGGTRPAYPVSAAPLSSPSPEVVLLLGAPGAGKGTQARFLAQMLGRPHIASGDLLRLHRQRGSELGRAAQG